MDASTAPVYLAIDVGASSGRVLAGCLHDSAMVLEEIHRFPNGPHPLGRRLVWNLLGSGRIFNRGSPRPRPDSVVASPVSAPDTWGVDYVLLDCNDDLVGPAFCYRDPRTRGVMDKAFAAISREQMFANTGLQFMELNTAYQLYAMRLEQSPLLDVAERFLMIPDFLHWQLCGEKCNEYTNASTTQLLDPQTGGWSTTVLRALELPEHIFLPPVQPGTVLGNITPQIASRTQLATDVRVIVPATHDTGSAVLAVPANSFAQRSPDWCYISCGTWSLMGVELDVPDLSPRCQSLNFTNEGGLGGSIRLLKNISGLWIVQQCREQWRREGRDLGWSELSRLAGQAPGMKAIIDPDDPSFAAPENMPEAIRQFCRRSGQAVPASEGEIVRCALESLALRYRMVLEMLEQLLGYSPAIIHMVGGGVQNRLLCQFAADACARSVVAGPVEATAMGNMLVQAIGNGQLSGIDEARQLVRNSPDLVHYQPTSDQTVAAGWSHGLDVLRRLTTNR